MGNSFMDSFCCINKTDIINNQNFPQNFNYKNPHSKYDLNKSLNPMERKSLPSNEIFLATTKRENLKITCVGKIPISSNNFIFEKYGNPCKDYLIIEKLGEGTYGEVFLAKHKTTNQMKAIKKIQKSNGLDEKEVKQEIEILKQLNHPYILKLYEYYIEEDYIYLIEEYCCEGDLSDKLYKINIFPEFIVKILMMQIFKALMYLYTKKIIHGDLKLENILIDSYNNEDIAESTDTRNKNKNNVDKFIKAIEHDMVLVNNGLGNKGSNYNFVLGRVDSITVINKKIYETKKINNFKFHANKEEEKTNTKDIHNVYNSGKLDILKYGIKLIDFGCSKIFNRTKRNFNDIVGTLVYCSPEVISNNYSYSCDIWASGVIMYILLSGIYPFYGESEEEITKNIITGKFSFDTDKFNGISEEAKDLIKKCFILDPSKRINILEALNHPFFDDLKDSKIFLEDEKKILSNLKSKPITPKFYQIVFTYMSYHFDDKEILSELSRMFYKIDKDSDGKISKKDLYKVYNEVGEKLSKNELERIIDSVDFDKNGYIEYEEFIRVLIPEEKLFTEQNFRNAFALFDVEKNGFITPTQIIDVLLKDEIISEKVKLMLKNEIMNFGDEIIEYEEFKNMMLTLSIQ